ncbi:proline racemase family protein [Galactobacter sp.]|uniref:proline racemase family protein n=1 Tax=Galactobacter sp. TaxID=2676125 RepID=UPI0025BF2A34|nr:proline racemase family protein [Galactobacter sp.]
MRTNRVIHTVETHVEGLGVRVVVGGVPIFPGATMAQRRTWFEEDRDDLRTFLMHEPRGHDALSGAILQAPTHHEADWGVLFIEVTGVLPMRGAGTMGVATALVDTGTVAVTEPVTTVRLDTPIGPIGAEVAVRDEKAESVTITNVASYAHALNQSIDVPDWGNVNYDLAFGGNFYAFVEADKLALTLEREAVGSLRAAGTAIMGAINASAEPVHPVTGYHGCEHVAFLGPGSDATRARHALINHPGWLDRSPGGTGTSALMALHHARGDLPLNTDFVNESFIGTSFTGRLVGTENVGGYPGVVPTVTGRAWVTGTAQYTLDPTDPFPAGFTL